MGGVDQLWMFWLWCFRAHCLAKVLGKLGKADVSCEEQIPRRLLRRRPPPLLKGGLQGRWVCLPLVFNQRESTTGGIRVARRK